jgi:hypothetical protein
VTGHLDIEALSAVLDGEATAAEAAHVETCAACQDTLARMRAAADGVGRPPAPRPTAAVEATVAAALAVWDERVAADPPRAQPRHGPPAWLLPVLAVAAALLVVVGAVALLGHGKGSTAASSSAVSPLPSVANGSSHARPSAGASSGVAQPAAIGSGIGALDTPAQLAAGVGERLKDATPSVGAATAACSQAVARAAAVAPGGAPATGEVLRVGPLTWRGQAAEAYVVPLHDSAAGPGAVTVAVSRSACTVLATARI